MKIAELLQVVCSSAKITSNFRTRVAYFQRRFGPMCPSSVFLFFFFNSLPKTMLSRNLSRKNIPKVFFRILWRPMTIGKPLKVVCSPPKNTRNFRPRVAYFQRRFGPMRPSSVFFIFYSSPNTNWSRNLSWKNIPKVLSGFSGGPWQLPNYYKSCALLSKQQSTSDHGWRISKDVSDHCALGFISFFFLFFTQYHAIHKFEP